MVRGLFPPAEQETVLRRLERSVVFLTRDNIERILFDQSFDHSAWTLANLYLASVGSTRERPTKARGRTFLLLTWPANRPVWTF